MGQVTTGKKKWSDNTFVAGQQFEYAFDDIGNRTQTKAGGNPSGGGLRTAAYSANTLNQVTSRDVPDAFDVIGNAPAGAIVAVNGDTNVTRHSEYYCYEFATNNSSAAVYPWVTNTATYGGATNTLAPGNVFLPEDTESFGYDADGNQTNDGRWELTWDAENRLVSMVSHSSAPAASKRRLEFTYDWMGRRIQKVVSTWTGGAYQAQSTNRFLYDGWNLIGEANHTNGVLRNYVWGLDLSGTMRGAGGVGGLLMISSNISYYIPSLLVGGDSWGNYFINQFVAYDGNGNVMAVLDAASGAETARYEYGPFGETIRVSGPMGKANPIRWSTKYTDDETDAVNYGYRYLRDGRWLNRDSIEETGGINLYSFVRNQAISRVDDSGMIEFIGAPGETTDRPLIDLPGPLPPPGADGPGGTFTPGSKNGNQNCAGAACQIDQWINWPNESATSDLKQWEAAKKFIPAGCVRVSNEGVSPAATRCQCGERELVVFLTRRPNRATPPRRGEGWNQTWLTDFHMIGRTPCGGPSAWESKKDKDEKITQILDPEKGMKEAYPSTSDRGNEIIKLTFCCKEKCQTK